MTIHIGYLLKRKAMMMRAKIVRPDASSARTILIHQGRGVNFTTRVNSNPNSNAPRTLKGKSNSAVDARTKRHLGKQKWNGESSGTAQEFRITARMSAMDK